MSAKHASSTIASLSDALHLRRAFGLSAFFVALLWSIKLSEVALGLDLSGLGIYPGRQQALGGILVAPLIHGSVAHLFANTAPVLVLGTALIYGYPRAARIALPAIYLGAGAGVWLFARPAFHIGASGLTFGMMFFVFTIGALRWDRRAIALSLVVFFLYGGMIWGIFPTAAGISFEYHFFGAAIGMVMAILLRTLDPPPPEKHYDWEDEDPVDWPLDDTVEDDATRYPFHRGTAASRHAVAEGPGVDPAQDARNRVVHNEPCRASVRRGVRYAGPEKPAIQELAVKDLMILPARDATGIRLVRIPADIEEHEAFRHVTGLIAAVEEQNPDYRWEDIESLLEDHGFEPLDFVLGPALD